MRRSELYDVVERLARSNLGLHLIFGDGEDLHLTYRHTDGGVSKALLRVHQDSDGKVWIVLTPEGGDLGTATERKQPVTAPLEELAPEVSTWISRSVLEAVQGASHKQERYPERRARQKRGLDEEPGSGRGQL